MSYVGQVVSSGDTHLVASTLYGVCSSISSESTKIVTLADYDELIVGTTIHVKFIYTNTADEPVLDVNGTGEYPIYTDSVNYPGKTPIASWQANSVVSFTYDGTAWRMNDVGAPASNQISNLLNLIYPVGAIYLSTNSTSPAALFGGTWEQIKDAFLLAAGTNHSAGSTGGAENVTLTTANLPSHSHQIGAHAHGLNSHVHSVGAHSHGLNNHTHSIPSLSGSTSSNGNHIHQLGGKYSAGDGGTEQAYKFEENRKIQTRYTSEDGAHTHSISTNASTTGGNSGSTANSAAFNTGAATGNTANSAAYNSGNTGSGTAVNTMPPYLTVYAWKRVS